MDNDKPTALIVVDCQNDFAEGGSLAVAGAAETILAISDYIVSSQRVVNEIDMTEPWYTTVVATADWHSSSGNNGGHFGGPEYGVPINYVTSWPVHCVAGTNGSRYHDNLKDAFQYIDADFMKGNGRPAYSGFEGINPETGESLDSYLKSKGIRNVEVVGIATDHCVWATARDAIHKGYNTEITWELTAAVQGEKGVETTKERFNKLKKELG